MRAAPIPYIVAIVLVLTTWGSAFAVGDGKASARAEGGAVFDSSGNGVVVGPKGRGGELSEDAANAVMDRFLVAQQRLQDREFAPAAAAFDLLLEETGWAEAAYNGALAWYGAGRYSDALTRSDRAVTALADDPAALYLHGVLLQALGRHDDARSVIERTLELARGQKKAFEEAVGLVNLGHSSRLLGRSREAVEHFDAAGRIAGELGRDDLAAAALVGAGHAWLQLGETAAAEDAWRRARRAGSRAERAGAHAEVDLALARSALTTGDRGRASSLLASVLGQLGAITEPARKAGLNLTIASLQRDLGEAGAALDSLSRAESLFAAAQIEASRADVLFVRAAWALESGGLEEGERLLEEVLAIRRRFQVPMALAATRLQLAQLRNEQGRAEEALGLCDLAFARFEASGAAELTRRALLVRSQVLRKLERFDDAVADLERVRRLAEKAGAQPEVHQASAELAIIRAAGFGPEPAMAEIAAIPEREWALLPARTRARVRLQLGFAWYEAAGYDNAVAQTELAVAAAESSERTHDLIGPATELMVQALLDGGRADDAERFLAARSEQDPDLARRVAARQGLDSYNDGVDAYDKGDYRTAVQLFEAARAAAGDDTTRFDSASRNLQYALWELARELVAKNKLEGAQSRLREAVAIAEQRKDPENGAQLYLELAAIREQVEDLPGSAALAEQAAGLAAAAGITELSSQAWMMAGQAWFDTNGAAARRAFKQSLSDMPDADASLGNRAAVTYNLALLDLEDGDRPGARQRLAAAAALARKSGDADFAGRIDALRKDLE